MYPLPVAHSTQIELKKLIVKYPVLASVPLWVAAILTGVVSVYYSRAFAEAEFISRWLQASHWLILVGPLCFVLSWYVVYAYSPVAKGSGIPQVMAAIALVDDHALTERKRSQVLGELVGTKTTIVKILSSVICVIGGGAIGREGPTLQIAAGLFFATYSVSRNIFPVLNAESWLIAGGGAGIAAAFNTPLGGLVYAIEELATKHFNQFRTTLISAVMVSGMAALWLAGNYLYFGAPKIGAITTQDHFFALFVGALGGLGGGLFGALLTILAGYKSRLLKGARYHAILALVCGLLIVGISYFVQADAIGSGHDLVLGYLSESIQPHFTLTIARFFSPIISYVAGGAGGIFAPSLAAGASIGATFARFVDPTQIEFFVIMGMIGFLTGVTHAPFTSLVLILEMTDRHSAIFPMMLATFAGYGAARMVSRESFYEIMKHQYLHFDSETSVSSPQENAEPSPTAGT